MMRKQIPSELVPKSLLYNSLYIAASLGLYPERLSHSHIIFDLGGVLLNLSSLALARHVGIVKMLCCMLRLRHKPRDLFFKALDDVDLPAIHNNNVCDELGRVAPKAMLHWFLGAVTCHEIRAAVDRFLDNNQQQYNRAEKTFIRSVTCSIFDPVQFAQSASINKEGLRFVFECIAQGHKVYILSNWDAESFYYLKLRFPEIFELFDGIVISGHAGAAKPDPAIFYSLLDNYGIDPGNAVFIDDQDENLKSAEALGIHPIKCSKHGRIFPKADFCSVRTAFEAWYIERMFKEHLEQRSRRYPAF